MDKASRNSSLVEYTTTEPDIQGSNLGATQHQQIKNNLAVLIPKSPIIILAMAIIVDITLLYKWIQ
jgi:hypothetical protein